MNEQIKELAEQAGLEWVEMMQTWLANDAEIERLVELVIQNYASQLITDAEQARKDEREACAKICDDWFNSLASEPEMEKIAAEIRARGNT